MNNSASASPSSLLKSGVALALLVVLAYWAALRGEFLWDDNMHVTANPTIVGPLGLKEIWTTAHANYFPLVLTNFWVQHALWDLNPVGYHVVTLVFHVLAAVLFWRVLAQLGVPGAWLGAALWALHPVQVESVAWICELKNTQSGFFFLLAILFWLRWLKLGRVSDPPLKSAGAIRGGSKTEPTTYSVSVAYALALICAIFALLSKPSTVMLPVALALCVWWQRRRLSWRDLFALAPFCALSALASGWTIWEQRVHSGATGAAWDHTWPERVVIAGRIVWFYLGKLFWPEPLIFIYPRWQIDAGSLVAWLPAATMALAVLVLWRARNGRLRPLFFGALYFGALLFPVLGFFSVYFFRYSFVGDHFQYLASMGPMALAGAGLTMVAKLRVTALSRAASIASGALVVALGTLTWRQCSAYANPEALWRATLARNPTCEMALTNLADTLTKQGRFDEVLTPKDEELLRFSPDLPGALNNLGLALAASGRLAEAIRRYERALEFRPDFYVVYVNLAQALIASGREGEALTRLEQGVRVAPNSAEAHFNFGSILAASERVPEAIVQFDAAVQLAPDVAEVRSNIGRVLHSVGCDREAAVYFEAATRLQRAPTSTSVLDVH